MRTAAIDNLTVYREVRAAGHDVRHMRLERHLEIARPRDGEIEADGRDPDTAATPDWWEPIGSEGRAVPAAREHSPFKFFLDGAQRTLPSFFVDIVPISSSINAAAILERDEQGNSRITPNTLQLQHTWLIPKRSKIDGVNAIIAAIEGLDKNSIVAAMKTRVRENKIVDPLDDIVEDADYEATLVDYDKLATRTKIRASKLRQKLEDELLRSWSEDMGPHRDWIVVDGTLRRQVSGAIGLAKSFTYTYLSGADYEALYRLEPGHRTRAFQFQRGRPPFSVVAWYLRLWDATGRDPRYSLVRVETTEVDPDDSRATERIDDISGWLLAERIPSAKADERWATLLYPVHHLERILKRRLDMETRSWWKQS